MTDPQQYVADQIGQQAQTVTGATGSSEIVPPAAGLGVTSVDADSLLAEIKAMQARLNDLEAEKAAAAGGDPLINTVKTVNHFLAGHGDAQAVELGQDLAAAVDEAGKSGDTSQVAKIAEKLDRHLSKNAPYAGENYFHKNAQAFVGDLPDLIDSFKPVAQPQASPAKVVAGSVIG